MEFEQNATAERKKYQLCRDRFHNFNVDLNLQLNQGWLNLHIYSYLYLIYRILTSTTPAYFNWY